MALGLVPLIVVLSIADGMIDSISARTIETALYHVQAWPLTVTADTQAQTRSKLRAELGAVPGFRSVWPEQQGFALAYSRAGRLGLSVRGIDPSWPAGDPGAARYLKAVQGKLTMPEAGSVWLGREAARKLGVGPGDELKLLTTRTRGTLTFPRVTPVRVAAVVSVGYQELDRLWLFAPLDLTESLFDPGEEPVFWGIKADVPLEKTPEFLQGARRALGPNWQAVSWQSTGRSQFLNYQATRAMLAIVMSLILLVAAVNVSTAMVTTVGERRRETAILKALGASDSLIRRQFLVLGLGAGVAGTLAGLGIGLVVAWGMNGLVTGVDAVVSLITGGSFRLLDSAYYLETIPVRFDPVVLGAACAGSVLLAVLASWFPARRAARERPIEVLRRV
jgi:lipoprotein-releasing system permease protein